MLKFIKNKFVIVTIAFLVWILFFDPNNVIHQLSLIRELHEVEKEREFYKTEIIKDSTVFVNMQKDINVLEKYGRERYFMKKDNEDIFLIVYE